MDTRLVRTRGEKRTRAMRLKIYKAGAVVRKSDRPEGVSLDDWKPWKRAKDIGAPYYEGPNCPAHPYHIGMGSTGVRRTEDHTCAFCSAGAIGGLKRREDGGPWGRLPAA